MAISAGVVRRRRGLLLVAVALACGGDGKGGITEPHSGAVVPVASIAITGAVAGQQLVGGGMQLVAATRVAYR